ncbi:glycine--tRNA ligase subunit beta [Rhizosaccharibacter radicis]|uniref:Glycine--tRNA ligase beta subunit n=1 Tax=Rhizosaccharibacter radicis TaxID=2782605 RepID=A0ABT1VVI4_9PROT|nr:glycine--tRNA ligase subunit beta [Acetobacteraceae bacterium KSS12]
MAALFLELFSEEIPARMQERAAADLQRLLCEALSALAPRDARLFSGPRRIAIALTVENGIAGASTSERGPREGAPEQALAGFLRKHGATREQLSLENGFWVLEKRTEAREAAAIVSEAVPVLLRRFPWPKSMRWGRGSAFTWVRPLRRITCLLDGAVVPFALHEGDDDGHGLRSGRESEGHRFLSPGAFEVSGAEQWLSALRDRHVIADVAERRALVENGVIAAAAAEELAVVPDAGLVDEVTGLVEWPVPLLGRIDQNFMDLPPEVMQVSMRVNQRYFALRDAAGNAAPRFAFVANVVPVDGGDAIIAGNERVLRARFSDARHFWDLDRQTPLESRLPALDGVVFHAAIGSQGERVRRLEQLAAMVAAAVGADPGLAARAGRLAKADLTTGMVGEFPELQGVMGGYYALNDGEDAAVAAAIRTHYAPRGPGDAVPDAPVSIAVALADKLDTLAAFFAAGEKPGGSGDPFALRRAALGVIRIIRENRLRLDLPALFRDAAALLPAPLRASPELDALPGFINERLRVQLRAEGARHDVLAAVAATGPEPDLCRLLDRSDAVSALLRTTEGADLLAAARRAANILRIEEKKDGPHDGRPDPALFAQPEERALADAIEQAGRRTGEDMAAERFAPAMEAMASLRDPLDGFFAAVTVNAPAPELRRNRLRLLAAVRALVSRVADLSLIEG